MSDSRQVNRTREIEGLTNLYFVHPVSRVFVRLFVRLRMTPNSVSLLGIGFGLLAALAYFHYERWEASVAGFAFMIMWHVMDGADGQLARLTGQASELGRVMDGLCDHVSVALVYVSLAVAAALDEGSWVYVAAVAAGLSHVGQSSAYEFQRQMYDYWVHGKETARFVGVDELRAQARQRTGLARFFAYTYILYLSIQQRVAAFDSDLYSRLEELKEAGEPLYSRSRDLYRSANLKIMRRWSFMSSNPRTLAIFLACLARQPVLYFLFEFAVLNLVLVLLIREQRKTYRRLKVRLAEFEMPALQAASAGN